VSESFPLPGEDEKEGAKVDEAPNGQAAGNSLAALELLRVDVDAHR
jgi:hypothetical protein